MGSHPAVPVRGHNDPDRGAWGEEVGRVMVLGLLGWIPMPLADKGTPRGMSPLLASAHSRMRVLSTHGPS